MKLRHQVPSTLRNDITRSGAVLFGPLHREIDRLFEDFSQGIAAQQKMMHLLPNIDVAENNKEIDITVEMPGLERGDVDMSLEDNVLTIRGEKKMESHRDDKNVYVSERAYGTFLRTIELPAGVDSSKINATMSDGVLKITIPKPANIEAKKIEVKEGKNGKPSSRA
ncbi:Hsp20/alpha crystallin family protein [Hyphomicrobium sp.]|uniref:Hsp20/alpha crystallin family protein n=1 Tax=Hyphomicrobium sp. TaxID=82 RepID=UPI001DFAB207|nr:Hsp20/alpha crystallin family protein [Hyphomicrobium sp.]MBY0558713.1 Hsp20/alpha crystallin family protein [Hyphomicrobium sp.]